MTTKKNIGQMRFNELLRYFNKKNRIKNLLRRKQARIGEVEMADIMSNPALIEANIMVGRLRKEDFRVGD